MKKPLLLFLLILAAHSAMGWGPMGHATIAYIAEENLTPKAKKAVNEYLHGHTLVSVSSLNDALKSQMKVDMGHAFNGEKKLHTLPHTFEVNSECEPERNINDNGRYVKNCLYFIEKYAEDLKNAKSMDDSTRFAEITTIVHLVGDMHCPMHIRYNPDDMSIGYFNVVLNGNQTYFHGLWDDGIIKLNANWSYSDIARIVDHYGKSQVREWCRGDVWAWGKDNAINCKPVHDVKPGDVLDKLYAKRNQQLMEMQLSKAGHRLATVLNGIFK